MEVNHVYRERNMVADHLAACGVNLDQRMHQIIALDNIAFKTYCDTMQYESHTNTTTNIFKNLYDCLQRKYD